MSERPTVEIYLIRQLIEIQEKEIYSWVSLIYKKIIIESLGR